MSERMRKVLNLALTIFLTISFALIGAFVLRSSYLRLWEALKDLWSSFGYYFNRITGNGNIDAPSVIDYSEILNFESILPDNFDIFLNKAQAYFALLISADNLSGWFVHTLKGLGRFAKIFILIFPILIAFVFLLKALYSRPNVRHNEDTIPLKIYKGMTKFSAFPFLTYCKQYGEYLKKHRAITYLWAAIWIFNLNFASIISAFFAYYFYFAVSFDIVSIYRQVVKLLLDLQIAFKTIPLIVYIGVFVFFFDRWRKGLALNKLHRMENSNRGFINDLPIVSMTCGSMGKKKTTIITDMSLSQAVMFRNIAYDKLLKTDMKFPNFGWIAFEMEMRKCMDHGVIYNLATVKEWIKKKRSRYEKHHNDNRQLYGYDSKRYGLYYFDGLKTEYIFSALETYAELYFIYIIETSLIVANYSIREDNVLISEGNFPLWQSDFFSESTRPSRHSHILDFDVLRLGKKVIENNPNSGSFEFGVVTITEVGKERGNSLELKEVKKGTEETNQKNDLFNSWLKMCRHSATVDNYPFIKVFTDEQRPSSWGADARDLCDILHIVSSGNTRLALPFYTIEEMISEWLYGRFIDLYGDFRFYRGDNTLFIHLLKKLAAALYKRNLKIYNIYGYSIANIEKERGTMDGKPEKKKYYLMHKKIYSKRFSTDCFSDYFNDLAKRTDIGLKDYDEYATEKASVEELKRQNSYFINSLYQSDE